MILPFAGLELALDIDLGALAQILLCDLGEWFGEDRHRMPFGPLLTLTRIAVAPGFRCGDPQVADLAAIGKVPDLGIAAEISYQNDLVILGVIENPSFDVLTSLSGTIQIKL